MDIWTFGHLDIWLRICATLEQQRSKRPTNVQQLSNQMSNGKRVGHLNIWMLLLDICSLLVFIFPIHLSLVGHLDICCTFGHLPLDIWTFVGHLDIWTFGHLFGHLLDICGHLSDNWRKRAHNCPTKCPNVQQMSKCPTNVQMSNKCPNVQCG